MRRIIPFRAIALILLAATACTGADRKIASPFGNGFPVPTKDDVLWVDGRRLSLSGYAALRESLPPVVSKDYVLWVAMAALAIQNDSFARGQEIHLTTAVEMARFAQGDFPLSKDLEPYLEGMGPRELKSKIEGLIIKSTIQRNPQVLAEIH